ncbi:TlyA family RNA methyltransferase [Metamycoplasma neophronis]|uniref:TlyA family RNA methyltransferase n=1 Tax=Metamycoplasma neophronis TaxID=872983 RepID=A0ABY2Z1D1_9BACT|nr:TlyA family RNA methyltransferase [Metamycoplasma neophronis]TPR54354.1 TlyA family RNA methyltransferase [Metamycoplasma neophronis]
MKKTLKQLVALSNNIDEMMAEALIREGKVIANGEKVFLPSLKFDELKVKLEIIKDKKEYVSRGAYKLIGAIEEFNIDVKNKVCIDIGSSTGGFVQVLLENGAKKVYAIDSGTNQLDYSLRTNASVVVYEKTNLKNLTLDMFAEQLDLATCDVSFISLKHVFKICSEILPSNTILMALIKPQFEAISKYVEEGGYVNPIHHEYIINKVIGYANEHHFKLERIAKSPITGDKSKNIEYISIFRKD